MLLKIYKVIYNSKSCCDIDILFFFPTLCFDSVKWIKHMESIVARGVCSYYVDHYVLS